MHIHDRQYGEFEISDPVILDLLRAPEVERMRGIAQHGPPPRYMRDGLRLFNRLEHSIGVMLLLRSLGASLEEQVAGLLHDVSHLAFSHV